MSGNNLPRISDRYLHLLISTAFVIVSYCQSRCLSWGIRCETVVPAVKNHFTLQLWHIVSVLPVDICNM